VESKKERKTKKIKVTINVSDQRCLSAIVINQCERAKVEQDVYKFKAILPSMAFSVFSVEALCNLYGSQLFPPWDHFESTSFIGKIVMISDFLGVQVDFSKEPWQIINQMKNFRNSLVHAKPHRVPENHEIDECVPNKLLPYPRSKKSILSYSSIENAERFERAARELEMTWMHRALMSGYKVETVNFPEYEEL